MEATAAQVVEVIQEGSRWLHGPPTPQQLGKWFSEQPLHEGMDADRYVGGVVLIPSTEKVKRTRIKNNGETYINEEEVAAYTPYVRVDTRIAYFRDWVAMHEDWVAEILPVPARVIENPDSAYFNAHIADRGYAIHPIRSGDAVTYYVACTMEVAVYERESYAAKLNGHKVRPVIQGQATKQVAMTRSHGTNRQAIYADDNCLMKAETGAVGRALGFMGILVVGTGVATAEDMEEATREQSGATPAPTADLPPVVNREGEAVQAPQEAAQAVPAAVPEPVDPDAEDARLRAHALELQNEMQEQYPDVWKAYMEWWRSRSFGGLATLTGPALKTAVTKLERDLDGARTAPGGEEAS